MILSLGVCRVYARSGEAERLGARPNREFGASLLLMGKLSSLLRKLRPRTRDRTALDKENDSAWDARTGSMLEGKGLSPTGAVMDFESDSKRPK
jgi:hypothetical protein